VNAQAVSRGKPLDRKTAGIAVCLGVWCAAVILAPTILAKTALLFPVVLAVLAMWILAGANRWVVLFLLAAILLPPLPIAIGNSGPHPALLVAALGLLAGVQRLDRWQVRSGSVALALGAFLAVLLFSLAQAALYSGTEIALASLARVCLFAITPYVFLYTLYGPGRLAFHTSRLVRWLFWAAVVGALFACLDFYFQWPAPAGFGAQFVWLSEGVFRRAQGLFYEASTLGNFCAFFLVMIAVSLFSHRREAPASRLGLVIGGLFLAIALVLSYSRASMLNVFVAVCVLAWLKRAQFRRIVPAAVALAAGSAAVAYAFLPVFAAAYWTRLLMSFQYFWSSPNGVLSGRLDHWTILFDFASRQPWALLLGIGYKTLPYSDYIGTTVIGDNTYFTLLIETGIVGLMAFLWLNFAILRSALRAVHSRSPRASFLGTWIFCFWIGELVQMASGDLITYWRVLPIYFWVLASAIRESEQFSNAWYDSSSNSTTCITRRPAPRRATPARS
jgi:O-antigen ligase